MHTNNSPAGRCTTIRCVWLLPLMLALAACGGGGGGGSSDAITPTPTDGSTPAPTTPESTPPGPTPGAQIPEALRGQWEAILAYVPPYYVGPFGTVAGDDGSLGVSFFFYPDGRYQHAWNSLQTYFGGNCIRTGQWQEAGTLSNVGADFTFTPSRASYLQTDTCGQFKVVDPAPVSPGTHTLTLDHDDTGWPLLRVSFPTGELVLEKCRHCQ